MNHIFMPEEREAVLECLAEITRANGGSLTFADALDATDGHGDPLNPYFEDDSWQTKQ